MTFDDKGKGKKGDKGKEKGKGKDKDGKNGKGKEKGKDGKGKSGKDKDSKDKGKGGAAKDSGKGSGSNKDKDKEKEERLKNIKCYNCDQYGHYSNKCPKPKREKASAAVLLEPQIAAASVEPQLFAVALELGCPVVELDSEDGSDLSREDWEDFVASYECAWSEPVVLEGGEPVVALEVSEPPVELESSSCDVVVLGEVPEVFEVPTRTIELADSQEVPNRTPVELAESRDFPDRTPVELASPLEVSFSLAESEPLSFESGRFAAFQNGVELGMVHGLSCHGHGVVAHETVASASQQHDTMDWWLVDSGASAHIINQDTLSRVHVVSDREAASECISATGDGIGVRRSAVVRVPFVLVSGETVTTELQVLVAPVKFNLLSLGRLLGRSWTVDFLPNFKVEAAGYSLRTRWCSNCGWIMSRGVPLSESVAESNSVAVATRVSLKPSPAGEKPERRNGKEGGQGSGGVLFRLGEGVEAGRPSAPPGAARCDDYKDPRGLRGIPHRVYLDGDGGHHARPEPAFGASRGSEEEGGPEESGDCAGQSSCERGGGEVLEGAPGEGTVGKGGRRGQGQERTEAAEAKKRPEPKEAAEAKKRPEPREAAEAKKRPEPREAAEAKKRPEPKEVAEAKKRPEPKETAEAKERSEPTEAKEKAAPSVKRQPMPPKVKAMPKKAGKVKKVVLKSRAQRGIPERVDTALRMLSTKKRERKKMGYLVKAINHAMRRKAESQSGPPVRRTWAQHIKDHYAQIKDKEQPFVEVTVSEIIRGVPLQVTAQPKTPPAEPRTPPGAVIKVEGGLELPAPPPVPPRRRLPTPPRDPRAPSEAWSMVSSRDGGASQEKKKARIENPEPELKPGQTLDELGQIVDPDGSVHVE